MTTAPPTSRPVALLEGATRDPPMTDECVGESCRAAIKVAGSCLYLRRDDRCLDPDRARAINERPEG